MQEYGQMIPELVNGSFCIWHSADPPYKRTGSERPLSTVGREDSVGTSQVVKAIQCAIEDILIRGGEIVMASTVAAADNIDGTMYHVLVSTSVWIGKTKSSRRSGFKRQDWHDFRRS